MSDSLVEDGAALTPPGFYGKVPGRGDFVERRLPRSFTGGWDEWLRASLDASREALGAEWLNIYLGSPLWRFLLSPGACGDEAWQGVMMPSVDRVGRYFPLTICTRVDAEASLLAAPRSDQVWFEAAEALALATLDEDGFELDAFSAEVEGLGQPQPVPAAQRDAMPAHWSGNWRVPLTAADQGSAALDRVFEVLLQSHHGHCTMWWTAGSEMVEPSLLLCSGLPGPECFAAMLAGNWDQGWNDWAPAAAEPLVAESVADTADSAEDPA